VAVIYPCPELDKLRPAELVIAQMKSLLMRRKVGKMTRCVFLDAWRRLRIELNATPEYQQFRLAVLVRDGYRCVDCGSISRTVHHSRRVALHPDLALEPSNGEVICTKCHKAKHKCLRIAS
jgi:5-methylcytosine-specific restriction endonuclease McrA